MSWLNCEYQLACGRNDSKKTNQQGHWKHTVSQDVWEDNEGYEKPRKQTEIILTMNADEEEMEQKQQRSTKRGGTRTLEGEELETFIGRQH